MIFVKILDLNDLLHVYKLVLCFESNIIFDKVLDQLQLYDYIWTGLKGTYSIVVLLLNYKFVKYTSLARLSSSSMSISPTIKLLKSHML